MHNKLVAMLVKHENYTIGYLKYGNVNIWSDIGSYDEIIESVKHEHLQYLEKYSFYEQNQ